MSGRGKGGKGLSKKPRVSEFEWESGQDAFEVAYVNNGDCELSIYTVPVSKMDPVLAHVFETSGTTTFMWDLGQEDTMEDLFEILTKKEFDKHTGGNDGDEEEEEEGDDEPVDDKDEVIDHIRDWVLSLPGKFSEPAGVPVNILCKFGIYETV